MGTQMKTVSRMFYGSGCLNAGLSYLSEEVRDGGSLVPQLTQVVKDKAPSAS